MNPENHPPRQAHETPPLHREMNLYCGYLTGQPADGHSLALFTRAVEFGIAPLDDRGKQLLRFLIRNQWSFGCVDAALGVFLPRHGLRRRMMLAFAILETNPACFEVFRPRQFSRFHVLTLGWKGALELVKAVFGRILLGFV
jgi:hypothetical protein